MYHFTVKDSNLHLAISIYCGIHILFSLNIKEVYIFGHASCMFWFLICWQVFLECHLQYCEQEALQLLPIPLVSALLIFLCITCVCYSKMGFMGNIALDFVYWFPVVNVQRPLHGGAISLLDFFRSFSICVNWYHLTLIRHCIKLDEFISIPIISYTSWKCFWMLTVHVFIFSQRHTNIYISGETK